jgi:hypothetical protein
MSSALHIRLFFAHNGLGPYTCFFCGDDVALEKVTIHHKNHDHDDNRKSNLKASHSGCHSRHHATGRVKSVREREKISTTRKGMFARGELTTPTQGIGHSPETCAKISVSHMGIRPSDETRAKISAANKGNSDVVRRGWETRRSRQ